MVFRYHVYLYAPSETIVAGFCDLDDAIQYAEKKLMNTPWSEKLTVVEMTTGKTVAVIDGENTIMY